MLLVDSTGSIAPEDQALYKQAAEQLVARQEHGDHCVIGSIADRPVSRFLLDADVSVPTRVGKRFEDEAQLRTIRKTLRETASRLVDSPARANGSYILDSLEALKPLLDSARKENQSIRFVLPTDGIEETPEINLARADFQASRQLLQNRKARLPNLSGTEIFMVGAGGQNSAHYARIESFWRETIATLGGRLSHYGRTRPTF